jgi:hypothetical protein
VLFALGVFIGDSTFVSLDQLGEVSIDCDIRIGRFWLTIRSFYQFATGGRIDFRMEKQTHPPHPQLQPAPTGFDMCSGGE